MLLRAATICFQEGAPFKFLLDRRLVVLATSKGWPRAAAGKFITVFPLGEEHFRQLLDALYEVLRDFDGPYILSDRRYRDASTIYYRYGGIDGLRILSHTGERQYVLVSPEGGLVPDVRSPYWNPPSWVTDPFPECDADEDERPRLKSGRYEVTKALGFSVSGGVYLATDLRTTAPVVIKEARPGTGLDGNDQDAVDRLRKEHRLLQRLQDTRIAPAPIDLFADWEHLFLVEEYIDAPTLGHFTIGYSPIMRVHPEATKVREHVERLRRIWMNLARSIGLMHERGIACGDLSLGNVLVTDPDQGAIRIIDLEAAYEEGVDQPTNISTPGFSLPTAPDAAKDADVFGLGALMLGTLFPMNNLLDVAPSAKATFVGSVGDELRLPGHARQLVLTCMSDDRNERPSVAQVLEALRPAWHDTGELAGNDLRPERDELVGTVARMLDYIRASADPDRTDRLCPADPAVFYTSPTSVAYGAAGIAYALNRIEGEVPRQMRSWILSQSTHWDDCPPGLYMGSAGIAWVLWEIGLQDVALQIAKHTRGHPRLWDAADVFFGASGYGLACLRFHLGTGEQSWLDHAVTIGEWLLRSRLEDDDRGCFWPRTDGTVPLGYAQGASGIALFLLYLSIATGDRKFLSAGRRAIGFDLSHARATEEGHLSIPRGPVGSFENVLTHYWLDGTAGVATALLRFLVCTREAEYQDALERLAPDACRKLTSFPGLFRGLSGLGNFLLDAFELTGEQRYLREAYRVASGVLMFKVERDHGIAVPGEQLLRISTDFGTGSAGVALFLDRLAHGGRRGNFNFTLDALTDQHLQQGPLLRVAAREPGA